jgi:predicted transglutaminase-like cysteine proteinase
MFAALILAQQVVVLPYTNLERCHRERDPGCIVETWTPLDLALVNKTVTQEIETVADSSPSDPWLAFPRDASGRIAGDCDDDAATKRAALIALGFDPKAMHFETGEVKEPDGSIIGHIVLVVTLNGKNYYLDRKTPDLIYTADKRPYEWRLKSQEVVGRLQWRVPD